MFRLVAIAFMPVASVIFGAFLISILVFPSATSDFATGAWLIYGAAAASVVIALPIAWFVARRMLSRRERRLLDAGAEERAGNIGSPE
jgi:ABC-type Fe3+ transport system permease subunit